MFQFLPRALRPQTIRRKLQWGFTAAIVLVLLAVFSLYLQPDFLMTLGNQIWACF